MASTALCVAKLRDGSACHSVAAEGDLCAHHATLAVELGRQRVVEGDHARRRNGRERIPVIAESEPVALATRSPALPSAVRPALALTAADELETIRTVLLDAATSTSREQWATCSCPECGKTFRQEISVPDHGARIKAIETLLREGLGRAPQAEELPSLPQLPRTEAEARALDWDQLKALVIAYPEIEYLPEGKRKQWLVSRWVGLTQPERDSFRAALDAADATHAEQGVV